MALATERDPIQTLIDILDATSDSDYTGSKPGIIERLQESTWKVKTNRQESALYVWPAADGTMSQFGASSSTYQEADVVQVEAWTPTSASKAHDIGTDLRDHIWATYGQDNQSATAWHRIQPVSKVDYRDEARSDTGTQFRVAFQVRLSGLREP